MEIPFKSKDGTKQSMARLSVIAGITVVIGCTTSFLHWVLIHGGDWQLSIVVFIALLGLCLTLFGAALVKEEDLPLAGLGTRILIYCIIVAFLGIVLW